jgi:hypothetical protein
MSYRTLHSRSAHIYKDGACSYPPRRFGHSSVLCCNVAACLTCRRVSHQKAVRWGERADQVTGATPASPFPWTLLIHVRCSELQCENTKAICLPGIAYDYRHRLAESNHHKEFPRVFSYSTPVTAPRTFCVNRTLNVCQFLVCTPSPCNAGRRWPIFQRCVVWRCSAGTRV